ncbi:MAG: hypothetical protein LBR94_08900 [Desulfovibrio sp.]|jgi:hypothetical protein|nr:hypothetical protein [Desulfovibrio sp.]
MKEYIENLELSNVTKKNIDGKSRQSIIRKCAGIEEKFMEEYGEDFGRGGCDYYASTKKDIHGTISLVVKAKKYSINDDKYIGELGEIEEDSLPIIPGMDIFSYILNKPASLQLSHKPEFFETVDEKGKQIVNVKFEATFKWFEK